MTAPMRDPFYLVKEELRETVAQVDDSFKKWSRLPTGSRGAEQMGRELEDKVDELDNAVRMSERDPARFRLTSEEVAERRRWVEATRTGAQDMQKRLLEARSNARKAGDVEMGDMSDPAAWLRREKNSENDSFIASQDQGQQLMLQRQDEDLEAMSQQVGRIGEIGLAIGQELKEQSRILDTMGEEMDSTSGRLKLAQRKVQEILRKTSGRAQCYIMIALIVLLCILMILAFS